ncbi:MAG: toll/interleukin-1 receptor domain-containing protein, partial [Planctomycetaceae bacterium]|nr:toll/interleukin-1 receptor domain-containing protein [Planctomycetaceae bacterium]
PIVHLEGRDYFLLFYRDIFPIGWNIANGASDDEEEWIDPGRIIHREFAEEVLCTDPTDRLLYLYEPPGGRHRFGFHRDALSAWLPHRPELAGYRQVPMSFKWIEGPDSIRIEYGRETYEHDGFFLSVTPDDQGIEVDRLVLIRLPGDSRLLSGEISDGAPFNQIVGLFDVERLRTIYPGNEFLPDLCFFNGERCTADEFHTVLPKYLAHVRSEPGPGLPRLRRPDQCEFYEAAQVRYDVCPISRAIIGRYYDWREQGGVAAVESHPAQFARSAPPEGRDVSNTRHDLFISHASRHLEFAREVHQHLARHLPRHPAFLSTQSLVDQGESNYRQAIERALEEARCLIVVLLDPEDLQSGWINYEWTAFSSEIIAGRKQGKLFTLIDRNRLTIEQLPLGLRQHEVIPVDRKRPNEGITRLLDFLSTALTAIDSR